MNAANKDKVMRATARLMGEEQNGYFALTPRPWWRKLLQRVFPSQHLPAPGGGVNYSRTYVKTRFDWKDRLRVLITGRLCTEVVLTEQGASYAVQYVALPGDF